MNRREVAVRFERQPWDVVDRTGLVGCCAASVALSGVTIGRRPDLVMGADFLFQDAGHNLLVADKLLSGQALYRDVFYPYGPLPAYAYASMASVFGNTPATYLALLAAISAVNACLAFVLVRRTANTATAVLVTIGLLALLPIPGAIAGGFTVSPYLVLERTLLLVVALCWKAPDRSWGQSVLLGLALGAWQGVKFGGAVVAGSAVFLLDALYLLALGFPKVRPRAWLRSLLLTLAAFVVMEVMRIVVAVRTGPHPIALDTMFPLYMFQTYSAAVADDIRWPLWDGWRLAVGQYLLPVSAGALGLAGLVSWIRHLRRGSDAEMVVLRTAGAIFVPLLFFALSAFTYFRHVHHFQQFLWALVPAAAWQFQSLIPIGRLATLLAWAPGVLIVLRSAFVAPTKPVVHVSLPTGGEIVVDSAVAARITFLERLASDEAEHGAVLYVPLGSGWQFAYGQKSATRHTWFFAPEVVRPYEQDEFLQSLDRTRVVVTCDVPNAPARPLHTTFPLPAGIAARAYNRLELHQVEAGCRVYRVRRPES